MAEPIDRAAINAARSLMMVVVVNYRAGRLVFDWQHGGESDLHVCVARGGSAGT